MNRLSLLLALGAALVQIALFQWLIWARLAGDTTLARNLFVAMVAVVLAVLATLTARRRLRR